MNNFLLGMDLPTNLVLIALIIGFWTLPWKGYALWKAAQLSHKYWFIILLITNTIGILEIIYIFFVAKKYQVQTTEER